MVPLWAPTVRWIGDGRQVPDGVAYQMRERAGRHMTRSSAVDPVLDDDTHIDIQSFDHALDSVAPLPDDKSSELVLDLRRVTYLDHECLLYLVGLISHRIRRKRRTVIWLPRSPTLLDFVRAWQLPAALETIMNSSFAILLNEQDKELYEKALRQPPRYLRVVESRSAGREGLLPVSYFAVTPIFIADGLQAATIAKSHWLDSHVVEVLDRHLKGYGDRVASNVIHEAVLNACTHPRATIGFTSAQLLAKPRPSRTPIRRGERELLVSIWDDGASFSDTLSAGLRSHGTIFSPAYGTVNEVFDVSLGQAAGRQLITSNAPLSDLTAKLAFAAFLLGVSSDPAGFPQDPDEQSPVGGLSRFSGRGLYTIRKTVIDQFNGEILYATGLLRVGISRSTAPTADYSIQMRTFAEGGPHLNGNLLACRMRLSSTDDG
jgi:hypothetical protein